MIYKEIDTIVLAIDRLEHGLRKGDLGAVVAVYPDAIEVEFVTGSGATQALLTLPLSAIRPIAANDLPSVRPINSSSAA